MSIKDHNISLRPYLPTGFVGTKNISKVGAAPVRRISFLDALASLGSMLESQWVMFLRFCQILGILQGRFRVTLGSMYVGDLVSG